MNKKIPYHLGIIIDGNRRWAKEKGLPSFAGHLKGKENVWKMQEWCKKKGIKILTVYGFSIENWKRSKKEINYLMELIAQALSKDFIQEAYEDGTKILVIGQKDKLPKFLQKIIKNAEEITKNNKKRIFVLAISYGGRQEIVETIKKIVSQKIPPNKITEELIDKNLWTQGLPYPDLIIRTAGEQRLSNFLTWQSAYSELYFLKKYWPDFTEKDLNKAIENYAERGRRFGK